MNLYHYESAIQSVYSRTYLLGSRIPKRVFLSFSLRLLYIYKLDLLLTPVLVVIYITPSIINFN